MPRRFWNSPGEATSAWSQSPSRSFRAHPRRAFEVIVADNASTDDSLPLLARDYPEVRVIRLDRNLGFTGACNAGLRAARGDYLILLKNDTEAAPDWLAERSEEHTAELQS